MIADIFIDGKKVAVLAIGLLAILIATCELGISKLSKELETNFAKAKEWQERLAKVAMEISYLSYPLMVVTLIIAIAVNV